MGRLGVLFFGVCSVGWACPRYMTWTELSDRLQQNIREEQMRLLGVSLECLIPKSGMPPKNFGQVLFQALWFETQMQHIATFFKRSVTFQTLKQYAALRSLCNTQFSNACGKPFKHRVQLYAQQTIEGVSISCQNGL